MNFPVNDIDLILNSLKINLIVNFILDIDLVVNFIEFHLIEKFSSRKWVQINTITTLYKLSLR